MVARYLTSSFEIGDSLGPERRRLNMDARQMLAGDPDALTVVRLLESALPSNVRNPQCLALASIAGRAGKLIPGLEVAVRLKDFCR